VARVSFSQFSRNLARYLDEVCGANVPLTVTRPNARRVVLMSEEDFAGLMETIHLLTSPANAARLLRSIADAEARKVMERDVPDLP